MEIYHTGPGETSRGETRRIEISEARRTAFLRNLTGGIPKKGPISEPKVTTPQEQASIIDMLDKGKSRKGKGKADEDGGKGKGKADEDEYTGKASESLLKIREQREEMRKSRPQVEEGLSKRLEKAIDHLVNEVYMPFFEKYDKEMNMILAQLPGVLEHLDGGSTKEIKLGLDSEKERALGFDAQGIAWMNYSEEMEGIADFPISQKITHLEEVVKKRLNEEHKQKNTTDERKEEIAKTLEFIAKHQKYLTSLQKTLREQYEALGKEVGKYKGQRNALSNLENLSNLQSELVKAYQGYLTFVNERPLSPKTKDFLLELAVERYKAKLDPKVISPLILSKAKKLVGQEQASETVFDEKIAKMQELQKRVAEDLGLEDYYYDSPVFLKSQKRGTTYYSEHPDLVCLRQEGTDCGPVCVQMVAADKNKAYLKNTSSKVEEMRKEFKNMPPPPPGLALAQGGTYTIMHPIVLKRVAHPIKYESIWNDRLHQWGHGLAFYLHQEYASSIGCDPRKITVDQFKSAISQKREEEPIFATLTRKREDRKPGSTKYGRSHFVLVDAMEIINGEAHVVYRDPGTGQGAAVSLKDFLEVWGGEACIPAEQTSP